MYYSFPFSKASLLIPNNNEMQLCNQSTNAAKLVGLWHHTTHLVPKITKFLQGILTEWKVSVQLTS